MTFGGCKMFVYCESVYGPQRCKVVKEIDSEYVRLQPVKAASGPFGFIDPSMCEFTTYKAMCWKRAKALNKYGTKHELSGVPNWKVNV